ncbi:MAG: hypothetical protein AB9866_04300 [Syntrophobacteraceae bacterium]
MRKEEQLNASIIRDFSQDAVGKAVLQNTLQHPLTLYPLVLGILGTAATVLLNFPFTVLLGSITAMGGGAASWVVNFFFRTDSFAKQYIQECQEAVARRRQKLLEIIHSELTECGSIACAEGLSNQGLEQLEQIQKRIVNLREILSDKLDSSELIYSRYIGVSEQVYLSVLDNLRDLIPILKSVSSINCEHIANRLKELHQLDSPADSDREEIETLTKRKALCSQQLQKAKVLLTRNEAAMTQMDDTTAAVANMDTDQAGASIDLEAAIEELQRLAKIAQQYS